MKTKFFSIFLILFFIICTTPFTFESEICSHAFNLKNFEIKLESLIFVSNPSDILIEEEKKGIFLKNINVPDAKKFQKKMSYFLKQNIDFNLIAEIKKAVILFYREHNILLVDAIIPARQDITSGSLYVVILRGKLGEIKVEGGPDALKNKLEKCLKTKKGEFIDNQKMEDDLEWLNKDPFRSVYLIYEKGEKLSSTDLILKVKEETPLSIYGGYEHSGFQIAGYSRWTTGFNLGHLWHQDHELNGQFRSASSLNELWAFAGNYIAPLPNLDIIEIFSNYVHTRPDIKKWNFPKHTSSVGKSWQVSLRYNFYLKNICRLSHSFILGYDFKRTNNFLIYSLIPIYRQDVDISQFLIRYQAKVNDCLGFTSIGASLFFSPGRMTAFNRNKYFEIERKGAKCTYLYGTINGDRKFYLPKDFSFLMHLLLQISTTKLMPSEQILLGGQFTIRGYKENAIIGDRGFLLKNEIQCPPLHMLKKIKNDDLHFLTFFDIGYTSSADKNVNKAENAFLMSIGSGLRYMYKNHVNIRIDYGIQLKTLKKLYLEREGHSRLHVGAFVSF